MSPERPGGVYYVRQVHQGGLTSSWQYTKLESLYLLNEDEVVYISGG